MGTENLNDFIYKYKKQVIDDINMRDEIAKWKGEHDGKTPEILIDLKEFPRMLLQKDKIGIILGGNYDRYNKMMRTFLENISMAGVKLVFFMPGHQYADDLQFLIPKTEEIYHNSLEILDTIDENSDLRAYLREKKLHDHMRMELSFDYNLKNLVSNFGHFCVTHEQHNQEIARYANKNADQVLALITNQNDFLAFSGGKYEYWRATSIDPTGMTCHRYNKKKLLDKLGFVGIVQIQLFSALCRSIFLPKYAIEHFLDRLAEENANPLQCGMIWNVSAYVKDQHISTVNDEMPYDLDLISRDVFGEDYSREQLDTIAKGLAYYNLKFELTPCPELNAFLQHCKHENLFAYKLATDDIFNVKDISYIDFRNYKSTSYAELVIPILTKMCGVLFKDDENRPTERKICMKHTHDELLKMTDETIMYPSMDLPELYDLMFKTNGHQFDQTRCALLEWMMNLSSGTLEKVQNNRNNLHFVAAIVTLLYLVQQKELTAKEANIVLYTEHQIRNLGFNRTDYPEQPNAHYVRIAHLYVKMYVLISHCLEVCGLQHMTDLLRFDGTIFHGNMEKFERASQYKLKSAIQSIWTFS